MQPERIPEALFFCLQFFIPLLLGVRVLKLELTRLNYRALVIAANNTLLIAGILTFGILFYEFVAAFYSGTDYEQYTFVNRFMGPFSMFAWLTLLSQVVIPQMMWARNLRWSITSAVVWVAATILLKVTNILLLKYVVGKHDYMPSAPQSFNVDQHIIGYGVSVLLFLTLLIPIYIIVDKNQMADGSRN
jgi:hypothetical protein